MAKKTETIELLRFPLAVLIISIHFQGSPVVKEISNQGTSWMLYATPWLWIRELFSCLSHFAVPVFFAISGYLFFQGGIFSKELYKKKLNSRIYSLLVPYIAWNLIRFICELPTKGTEHWAMIFLAPANGQFWFVRDLIYMSVISPIIFFIIKKTGCFLPLACYIITALGLCPWSIHDGLLTCGGLLYFSLGAYLSIRKLNIDEIFPKIRHASYLCLTMYLCLKFTFVFTEINRFVELGIFIASFPALFNIVRKLNDKIKTFLLHFAGTSFFIYAAHKLVGMALQKLFAMAGLRDIFNNDYFYIFRISIIASACIVVYYALKRYCPAIIFKSLTGNRK